MLVVCLAAIALGQPFATQPRMERLDNGLRVAIVEDHTLPLVSVQLWYRVGSAFDDPKNPGLCHVTRTILEHHDDAALRLRAAGVRFESRTLRDGCCFTSVLPPNFLEYVLQIEAERMRPLRTTPEMLAGGLAAAARDYGLQPDDPEKLAERRMLAAMFPNHPYQHPPGFVAESLKDLEPDDVDEFLQRWFVPGNATLFVIGDVSDVTTMELVRRHFGSLPWAEPPRAFEYASPKAEEIRLPVVVGERAGLDVAWLTPPAGYFENAALDVLMHRLCNPVDGPLAEALDKLGCPPPRWRRESCRDHGLLVVEEEPRASARAARLDAATLGAPAANPSEIERVIREQLKTAETTVATEIELHRARSLAARDVRMRRAAFSGRAYALAWHEIIAGDLLLADFALPRIAGITAADLQQAAAELRSARTVYVRRRSKTEGEGEAASPGSPTLIQPLAAKPPPQLDGAAALELLSEHATNAPPVRSPKPPGSITTTELDNGVKITVCAVPGLEPVEVRTLWRRGHFATDALMLLGSTRHSLDQVRDYLSYHGLDLYPGSESPFSFLQSRGPASRAHQMIELQAELIRYPDRSDAAVQAAAQRSRRLSEWLRGSARPDDIEPYLPPGTTGWYLGLRLASGVEMIRHALEHLDTIQRVEILVVGHVSPDAVCAAVRDCWSGWVSASDEEDEQSATQRREARSQGASAGGASPQTQVTWHTKETPLTVIVLDLFWWPPTVEQPERELVCRAVGRMLGAPWDSSVAVRDPDYSPSNLGAGRAWRWVWEPLGPELGFMLWSWPAEDELLPSIETFLDHMQRVQRADVPPDQAEAALRLARADWLLDLEDAGAIADLLGRGVEAPWDLLDDLDARECLDLVPRVWQTRSRSVAGMGPGNRSAELGRFESPGEPTTTQPDSP